MSPSAKLAMSQVPKSCRVFPFHASSLARDLLAPQAQAAMCSHQHVPRPALGMSPRFQPVQYKKSSCHLPCTYQHVSWREIETKPLGAGLGLCRKIIHPIRRLIQMKKMDTGHLSTEQGLDQASQAGPSPGPWYPTT